MFCFAWLAQGLDSGILAGQSAAGMEQALEAVGERLDGRAGLLDGGLLDGVARGAVGAGSGVLSGSTHRNGDGLICPSDHSV
jgi:hypothetical protein